MKTLFDPYVREQLLARIDRLTPEHRGLWGRMSVGQMVVHAGGHLRMALGELTCAPVWMPFRYPPLRQLVVYWLPWPKGAPTAPELANPTPGEWSADIDELRRLIQRFAERGAGPPWPAHPAFGRLSGRAWGVLAYRHLDHHLRQFGV